MKIIAVRYMFFKLLFAFTFGVLSNSAFAQNVSVKVIDSDIGAPLQGASLSLTGNKSFFYITDNFGFATIELKKLKETQKISISFLGYKTATIISENLKDSVIVTLQRLSQTLKEVAISNKKPLIKVGNTSSSGKFINPEIGTTIAIFIPNQSETPGEIAKVNIFIGNKNANPFSPINVHFYQVNPETGTPGDNIIDPPITVRSEKRKGWLSVDVSAYNLKFTKSGLFLGIEFPAIENNNNILKKENFDLTAIGTKNKVKGYRVFWNIPAITETPSKRPFTMFCKTSRWHMAKN